MYLYNFIHWLYSYDIMKLSIRYLTTVIPRQISPEPKSQEASHDRNLKKSNNDCSNQFHRSATRFNCPLQTGEKFEDYVLEFEQEETSGYHSYDLKRMEFDMNSYTPILDHTTVLPLTYELFANDAIFFTDLHSKKVVLKNPVTGCGVEVSFPDFATVAFWTAAATKAPFLCVEPWNGCAFRSDEDDNFLNRHYLQKVESGKKRTYLLEIKKVN